MTDTTLPDPLVTADGVAVTSAEQWRRDRRPEILELFSEHVYGRTPEDPFEIGFDVFDEDRGALGGGAIRRQVAINVARGGAEARIELLMYLPLSAADTPVPVFTLLNFGGNHTVTDDPAVPLARGFLRETFTPPEKFRGASKARVAIDEIIARGCGVATAYYGDIDPDFDDGFENGVHPLFGAPADRKGDSWGAIGAWAWGLSRIMDYFETDPEVDHTSVAVAGHSRLGKAALWAGAQDERFAVVISNNSGCGGAALTRGKAGETVENINTSFPHWFCRNYRRYNGTEGEMPVDSHMLVSLVAPRPVYVASATEDTWADPKSEFASCLLAGPVYELFGLDGVGAEAIPEPEHPLAEGRIGYHLRTGEHALTGYDWNCFMDFAAFVSCDLDGRQMGEPPSESDRTDDEGSG